MAKLLLFILALFSSVARSAQGDMDGYLYAELSRFEKLAVIKGCSYEIPHFKPPVSSLLGHEGNEWTFYDENGAALYKRKGLDGAYYFEKIISRWADCPESLWLIYNELDADNRLREK